MLRKMEGIHTSEVIYTYNMPSSYNPAYAFQTLLIASVKPTSFVSNS